MSDGEKGPFYVHVYTNLSYVGLQRNLARYPSLIMRLSLPASVFLLALSTVMIGADSITVHHLIRPLQHCSFAIRSYFTSFETMSSSAMMSLIASQQPYLFFMNTKVNLSSLFGIHGSLFGCTVWLLPVGPKFILSVGTHAIPYYRRNQGSDSDYIIFLHARPVLGLRRIESNMATGKIQYYPENVLLVILGRGQSSDGPAGSMQKVYMLNIFCDTFVRVCLEQVWPFKLMSFPVTQESFDSEFARSKRIKLNVDFRLWSLAYANPNTNLYDAELPREFWRFTKASYVLDYIVVDIIAPRVNATPLPMFLMGLDEINSAGVSLIYTQQALRSIYFTHHSVATGFEYVTFIYCNSELVGGGSGTKDNVLGILGPFDPKTWILLVVGATLTTVLLFKHAGIRIDSILSCLFLQSVYLASGYERKFRLLLVTWQLVTFFMGNLYTNVMESALVAPVETKWIRDFGTLRNKSYKLFLVSGQGFDDIVSAVIGPYSVLNGRSYLVQLKEDYDLVDIDSSKEQFWGYLKDGKHFFIHKPIELGFFREHMRHYYGRQCFIGEELIMGKHLVWVAQEPNGVFLHRLLNHLYDNGIIPQFSKYFELGYKREAKNYSRQNPLLLSNDTADMKLGREQQAWKPFSISEPQVKTIFKLYALLTLGSGIFMAFEYISSIFTLYLATAVQN